MPSVHHLFLVMAWITLFGGSTTTQALAPPQRQADGRLGHQQIQQPRHQWHHQHHNQQQRRQQMRPSLDHGIALTTNGLALRPNPLRTTLLQAKPSDDSGSASIDEDDSNNAWLFFLVLPLWAVLLSNQWSRYLIGYVVDFSPNADPFLAMNVAIGFNEGQYAILASLAFTILFAIASLGAGALADRVNRQQLTVASAIGWSVAGLGMSMSSSYEEVVVWRVVMGLACAFATPTAYSLINQNVPKSRVALASSIYGTGVVFGGAFASLSVLLDTSYGWQTTTQVAALFGILAAGVAGICVKDERDVASLIDVADDGDDDDDDDGNGDNPISEFLTNVKQVTSTNRVKWILIASVFRFSAGLCIGVWAPPYFRLTFPDNIADYAVAQAAITGLAGSASGVVGGACADWLSSQGGDDPAGRRLWIPVVGSALAAPAWYFTMTTQGGFTMAMTFLAIEYFVAECWFGPTISTLQATVGPKVGGTAQGVFSLTGAVANLAPTLLGYLYGRSVDAANMAAGATQSQSSLVDLLVVGVVVSYLLSSFGFAMAATAKETPEPSSES